MDLPAAVRRDIQQQYGAAADRRVIKVDQFLWRFDFFILAGVIEPARADGNIAFRGQPMGSRAVAGIQAVIIMAFRAITRAEIPGIQGFPAWVAGDAVLVPYPADIGTAVAEHAGVRLKFTDHL